MLKVIAMYLLIICKTGRDSHMATVLNSNSQMPTQAVQYTGVRPSYKSRLTHLKTRFNHLQKCFKRRHLCLLEPDKWKEILMVFKSNIMALIRIPRVIHTTTMAKLIKSKMNQIRCIRNHWINSWVANRPITWLLRKPSSRMIRSQTLTSTLILQANLLLLILISLLLLRLLRQI